MGIYRLIMKEGSDNFRESSIQEVIKLIASRGIKIIIFEPLVKGDIFDEYMVVNDLEEFFMQSDIILANRVNNELNSVSDKIFTRDIYNSD